jgi:hypothetical protein
MVPSPSINFMAVTPVSSLTFSNDAITPIKLRVNCFFIGTVTKGCFQTFFSKSFALNRANSEEF